MILSLNMPRRRIMNPELDSMKYYIAAEKISNLIFTFEMTFEYMSEYNVKPDEEVKKALNPMLEQLKEWLK